MAKDKVMRYVPVEDARKQLGRLVREAAAGEAVVIGRRGVDRAVLLADAEYQRLRQIEAEAAAARFAEALRTIGERVAVERLPRSAAAEAIRAVRSQRKRSPGSAP